MGQAHLEAVAQVGCQGDVAADRSQDACRVDWGILSDEDYDRHYAMFGRAPLLQSRLYADAICPRQGQRARRFALRDKARLIGIAQVQHASLGFGALQAVILDRGPLFFPNATSAQVQGAITAFARRYPRRIGRRRRVILEVAGERGMAFGDLIRLNDRPEYQTIWLNLRQRETELRRQLRGSWRRDLAKAERGVLSVHEDWCGDDLAWLLDRNDQAAHTGASRRLILDLARCFLPKGQMLILRVGPAKAPLAGALFLLHGQSATYQLGWVGAAGRKCFAGHLCLWKGVLALKARGCLDLDLGGVNDASASNIKRFKKGLGGDLVILPGQYR